MTMLLIRFLKSFAAVACTTAVEEGCLACFPRLGTEGGQKHSGRPQENQAFVRSEPWDNTEQTTQGHGVVWVEGYPLTLTSRDILSRLLVIQTCRVCSARPSELRIRFRPTCMGMHRARINQHSHVPLVQWRFRTSSRL